MKKINKHRRSIRILDYDYSQAGAYFITIVTQNRVCLFGEIRNEKMFLSDAGFMVDQVCKEIPDFLPGVEMDHYQIMPNHFHGIIVLNPIDIENGYEPTVGADLRVALFEPCLPRLRPLGWATTED